MPKASNPITSELLSDNVDLKVAEATKVSEAAHKLQFSPRFYKRQGRNRGRFAHGRIRSGQGFRLKPSALTAKTPMVFEGPSPVSTSHSLPDRPVHVYAPTLQPDNVNMLCKYRPVMFAPQPILQSPTVNPANPPVQ